MSGNAGSKEACEHCGLPLLRSRERFCCSGCYVAHHLLARGEDVEGDAPDRLLGRLVVSALLGMGVMVFSLSLYAADGSQSMGEAELALRGLFRLGALAFSLPVALLLGLPLVDAVLHFRRWLSSESLILAGVAAAWGVSLWNTFFDGPNVYYETATMVLVLTTLGRWLDVRVRAKARDRLRVLAAASPKPAVRLEDEGEAEVGLEELRLGDRLRVRAGEVLPVDGVVLEGRSFVETEILTGEAEPRSVGPGDRVWAGTRTVDGSLVVRAQALVGARLQDAIDRLLASATARRAGLVRLADRAASVFLVGVAFLAAGTLLWHGLREGWEAGGLHALAVVLIACPCALGLATPLAYWVALGEAWRRGALVHGGDVLERLARARRVFLDKTGTLTRGQLELVGIERLSGTAEDGALRLAAALEQASEHPIASAVRSAWRLEGRGALPEVEEFRALPGEGIEGLVEGRRIRLLRALPAATPPVRTQAQAPRARKDETRVLLECDGEPLAVLRFLALPRPEAPKALAELRDLGLEPVGLTGDGREPAEALGTALGIPIESELLPLDKARRVTAAGRGTLFVGDGLNDAPALAAADVGIAMRSASATSLEAASVSLQSDDLARVPELVRLARRAVRVARANLLWAFGYNAIGLVLAVSGRLTPIFAASAMVVSSLLVVLNSARLRGGGESARVAASAPTPLARTVASTSAAPEVG